MKSIVETERFMLREILTDDADGLFELDSDSEVHKYLGNNPVKTIEQIHEVIGFIQNQYTENGIARWAIIEKTTNDFVGWAGLKLVKETTNGYINYYDLGYRLIQKHWNKGIATEVSKAIVEFGFNNMYLNEMYAMADVNNSASNKVLQKLGFELIEVFNDENVPHNWYKLTK